MEYYLNQLVSLSNTMLEDEALKANFLKAKDILSEAISRKKKILVCGNGASAGEAQRFSLAFVVKYHKEHDAYPSICLASDPSLLTAIGNDFGFAEEFKRQVEAFGEEGDVLLSLSVSGNSENVIRAIGTAKERKMKTISLIGNGGGNMKGIGHCDLIVPSSDGSRIQEMHLFIMNALLNEIEASF